MCIIIHKPADITLDEIVYRNCFNRNDHGAGLCYHEDGKLIVIKGMNTVEDMLKTVKLHEHRELLIHFRLMSKGAIDDSNCHPFMVPPGQFPQYEFAVMHNGTLNWKSTPQRSDTSHFVEEALTPMLDRDPYFFDHQIGRQMMGAWIGINNKLAIMRVNSEDKTSDVYIINRQEGVYYNSCWFSNMSFTDDHSRFVLACDQDRMKHWKPKLWVDPIPAKKAGALNEWLHGMEGHWDGVSVDNTRPRITTATTNASGLTRVGPWEYDAKFGWHNTDPAYKGKRGIADYDEWKAKNNKGKLPPPIIIPPNSPDQLDTLIYLSQQEEKIARRECLKIVSECKPEFSPKKWSTIELAAFARAEIRRQFPEYEGLTNKELMMLIISGDEIVINGNNS